MTVVVVVVAFLQSCIHVRETRDAKLYNNLSIPCLTMIVVVCFDSRLSSLGYTRCCLLHREIKDWLHSTCPWSSMTSSQEETSNQTDRKKCFIHSKFYCLASYVFSLRFRFISLFFSVFLSLGPQFGRIFVVCMLKIKKGTFKEAQGTLLLSCWACNSLFNFCHR